MLKRPLLTVILASLAFTATLTVALLKGEDIQASVFNHPMPVLYGQTYDPFLSLASDSFGRIGAYSYCNYERPEEPVYELEAVSSSLDEEIEAGEVFRFEISYTNTGNTRLFADDHGCENVQDVDVLNLGTQGEEDRASRFGGEGQAISGWVEGSEASRIQMVQRYVDPGDTVTFRFQSIAPERDDIFIELFQPVVEQVEWMDEPFLLEIAVGEPDEGLRSHLEFVMDYAVALSELEGLERNVEVELDTQTIYLRYGETRVFKSIMSSGAPNTPTPVGTYPIIVKEELRSGYTEPYYQMPYFQMFTYEGHALHGLPYLRYDSGYFWKEASANLGTRVSHGCVRVADDRIETVFAFTEVGTKVHIHR